MTDVTHDTLLLLSSSIVGIPDVKDDLGDLDAVRIMLQRFDDETARPTLRMKAVQMLAELCHAQAENQISFRRLGGIQPLVAELEAYCVSRLRTFCGDSDNSPLDLSCSASQHVAPVVVAVLECLWNAVVGNRRSEARLSSARGIAVLLALIEVGPRLMLYQVCGILADLVLNPKLASFLANWNSTHTERSAAVLLCDMWQAEETHNLQNCPNVDFEAISTSSNHANEKKRGRESTNLYACGAFLPCHHRASVVVWRPSQRVRQSLQRIRSPKGSRYLRHPLQDCTYTCRARLYQQRIYRSFGDALRHPKMVRRSRKRDLG